MRTQCGTRSQESRRYRVRSHQLGSLARPCGRCAVYWDACLPCICTSCSVWPPLFGLPVRTRREKHACMHCAACRGCHEERERCECAIPLVLLRPLRRES